MVLKAKVRTKSKGKTTGRLKGTNLSPGQHGSAAREPKVLQRGLAEQSMGFLVRRTFQSFTRLLETRLVAHDVSLSMWFFLRLLWEGDGRSQKDMGDELGLAPPTIVAALDNMARRGLIRRERDLIDRRKMKIYLTPAGWALKEKLIGFAHEVNAIALKDLHLSEAGMLRLLLERVNASLEGARRAEPGK